jgi:cyanophycinase-like exopeptidase
MDRAALASTGHSPARVVVLPTAAVTGPRKAASNGVAYFSSLGASATALMVLSRKQADDDELTRSVPGASLAYFTGGDPDHLLATLEGSVLLDRLEGTMQNGGVVGGASAGAMVMGSWMRRPSTGEWVRALGLAPGLAVLPHHENSDPAKVARTLADTLPRELKVLGIDAETGCFGSPGGWRVLGQGRVTLYSGGAWTSFSHGEALPAWF